MKIFCVEDDPASAGISWYLLTDSCELRSGKPFFVPGEGERHEGVLCGVARITRVGKDILLPFASRYYQEVSVAVRVQNVTLLPRLKAEGLPWGEAVWFDGAVWTGDFIAREKLEGARVTLSVDGQTLCQVTPKEPESRIDRLISRLSQRIMLKVGDLVVWPLADNAGGCGLELHHPSDVTVTLTSPGSADTTLLRIPVR